MAMIPSRRQKKRRCSSTTGGRVAGGTGQDRRVPFNTVRARTDHGDETRHLLTAQAADGNGDPGIAKAHPRCLACGEAWIQRVVAMEGAEWPGVR